MPIYIYRYAIISCYDATFLLRVLNAGELYLHWIGLLCTASLAPLGLVSSFYALSRTVLFLAKSASSHELVFTQATGGWCGLSPFLRGPACLLRGPAPPRAPRPARPSLLSPQIAIWLHASPRLDNWQVMLTGRSRCVGLPVSLPARRGGASFLGAPPACLPSLLPACRQPRRAWGPPGGCAPYLPEGLPSRRRRSVVSDEDPSPWVPCVRFLPVP